MMVLEEPGDANKERANPFGIEDEELDKTNPFSNDCQPPNPFSEEESEITAGKTNPFESEKTTNPFESGNDVSVDDNSNDLLDPPTIEIRKASPTDNKSSASNPFDSIADAEDKYGDCYKDLDNTVGQTDEGDAESMDFSREADSIEVENKDDKFGKDFTMSQMRKRHSTIRRIGSLRKTPSMKAFRCPKQFCGFFANSADRLAIHVDRFHGTYHDLLSPASPKLSKPQSRKNSRSPVFGVKVMSDIIWGTMAAGKIYNAGVVQCVLVEQLLVQTRYLPGCTADAQCRLAYIILTGLSNS